MTCCASDSIEKADFTIYKKTHPGHIETIYKYDALGRLFSEEIADHTIEYYYDDLGRVEHVIENGKLFTHYKRDSLGHILEEMKGDGKNILHKISYTYDTAGNKTSITRYHTKPATDTFTYDVYNRLIEHVDSLGAKTTINYCDGPLGVQEEIIDPRNIVTLKTFDACGHLIKKTIGDNFFVERFYDVSGNLIKHCKNGFVTAYAYDSLNRMITKQEDFRIWRFTYTPSGKLSSKTLPSSHILFYEYDDQNFLKSITSSDGSIKLTFEHNFLGWLTKASDLNTGISITRIFDSFGNIIKEIFPWYTVEKTYDSFNRPLTVSILNNVVSYTYNVLYMTSVSYNGYTHYYNSYDLNGDLLSESYINGLGETKYTITPRGQVGSSSSPYLHETLYYDEVGNLLRSSASDYSYDIFSNLISENNFIYSYDANYNRIAKNGSSHNAPDYDVNGNVTNVNGDVYSYDLLGRLIAVKTAKKTYRYTYDPLGRRLMTDETVYLYDGNEEVGSMESGIVKDFRVLGRSFHGMAAPVMLRIADEFFVPILDHRKNAKSLIDLSGNIVERYSYSSFGGGLKSYLNSWPYDGKRYDVDTGLIYYGYRFYSPLLGSWLTRDPLENVGDINSYVYLNNNPYYYVDPDGASFWSLVSGVMQMAAGAALILTGGVLEVATLGGYTIALGPHEAAGLALMTSGCVTMMNQKDDIKRSVGDNINLQWVQKGQKEKKEQKGKKDYGKPRFNGKELGNDPTKCPGEGFEWKGDAKGQWHHPGTKESLRPDFNHPGNVKPHWDYKGPDFPRGAQLNLDGTWRLKK
jgi:RHS repeat-associated protein